MYSLLLYLVVLGLVASPLPAAATQSDLRLQKISAASEQLWTDFDTCMARIERTATFQRLDRTFILKRNDPRLIEKMVIDRFANDQEKSDLIEFNRSANQCHQHLSERFAEVSPKFAVLLARFSGEDDKLVLAIIQNSISVGESNQIVHERFVARLRDWNRIGEYIFPHTWHLRRTCSIYCSSLDKRASAAGGLNLTARQ